MKKVTKSIILTGIITAAVGIGALAGTTTQIDKKIEKEKIQAYNSKPANILDNVFIENNSRILPFILNNAKENVTVDKVKSEFNKKGLTVKSISPTGKNENGQDVVTTGTKITVNQNSNTYSVIIYGDVNGDGIINILDIQGFILYYLKQLNLNGLYFKAANLNNNDETTFNILDLQRIILFYIGEELEPKTIIVNPPASLKETDKTAPVITLTGANPQYIKCKKSYTQLGATATDNVDGNVAVTYSYSNVNINVPGTYQVTYTATDGQGNKATKTRNVIVQDYVTGIQLVSKPTKLAYKYGETLNLAGGSIKVVYASGKTESKQMSASDVKVTGYTSTLGTKTLTVSYTTSNTENDQSKTFTIPSFTVTVSDYVKTVEKVSNPTKVAYKYGETLNLAGGSIKVTYASGKVETINMNNTSAVTVSGYNANKIATSQTITVKHKASGKTVTFTVSVSNYVKNIKIVTKPTKQVYVEGETIDTTALVVNKVMADNTEVKVTDTNNLTITPTTASFGTNKVTITYNTTNTGALTTSLKAEYDISVKKQLTNIKATMKATGYCYETIEIAVEPVDADEENVLVDNLSYEIIGSDATITKGTPKNGKAILNFVAKKPDTYTIKITESKTGKTKEVQTVISEATKVDNIKLNNGNTIGNIKAGTETIIPITFEHNYAGKLDSIGVDASRVKIEGFEASEYALLRADGGAINDNTTGDTKVTAIRLIPKQSGTKTLKITVDATNTTLKYEKSQTINVIADKLVINANNITFHLNNSKNSSMIQPTKDQGRYYTLIEMYYEDANDSTKTIPIKIQDFVEAIGENYAGNPDGRISIRDSLDLQETFAYIELKAFANNGGNIEEVDESASEATINYIGIAPIQNSILSNLEGGYIRISYDGKDKDLSIEVPKAITTITAEIVSKTGETDKNYCYDTFNIAVKSGTGEQIPTDISYTVNNTADATIERGSNQLDGTPTLNFTATKPNTYNITITENTSGATYTLTIIVEENTTTVDGIILNEGNTIPNLTVGERTDILIRFKHSYGDGKLGTEFKIEKDRIKIQGLDADEYSLINEAGSKITESTSDKYVSAISIIPTQVRTTNLVIVVDNNTANPFTETLTVENKPFAINTTNNNNIIIDKDNPENNSIKLYTVDPTDDMVREETDGIYTLIELDGTLQLGELVEAIYEDANAQGDYIYEGNADGILSIKDSLDDGFMSYIHLKAYTKDESNNIVELDGTNTDAIINYIGIAAFTDMGELDALKDSNGYISITYNGEEIVKLYVK